MDVINRRHRMAQMAGRASVEFYVGLALKGKAEALAKGQAEALKQGRAEMAKEKGKQGKKGMEGAEQEVGVIEEAFVIRTFRNGVGVFVFQ